MWSFRAFCSEFFVSSRLRFKLELHPSRETTLHFFEQIRRRHPEVARLNRRDDGGLVLEEDEGAEERRFLRLDSDALRFGVCNAGDGDRVRGFGETVLSLAPCHLSLSDLDIEHMEVVFGFDLEYCGNHDQIIADTLFAGHPMMAALGDDGQQVIELQPFVGVALDDACELQAYVEVKSRTTAFEVRARDYEPAALSVFLTIRRYWGTASADELPAMYQHMLRRGEQLAAERLVPRIVRPLADAIASRL